MAMVREYETVYVLKPDLPAEHGPKMVEKVTKAIERQSGTLLGIDEWGKKKLAYDIAKNNRGVFVQVGYCGGGKLVDEVERELRLDDGILRHFTVKLADAVDAETRKKEYATTKRVRREAPEEDENRGEDREFRGGYDRGGYGDREERGGGGGFGGGRDFGDEGGGRDADEDEA